MESPSASFARDATYVPRHKGRRSSVRAAVIASNIITLPAPPKHVDVGGAVGGARRGVGARLVIDVAPTRDLLVRARTRFITAIGLYFCAGRGLVGRLETRGAAPSRGRDSRRVLQFRGDHRFNGASEKAGRRGELCGASGGREGARPWRLASNALRRKDLGLGARGRKRAWGKGSVRLEAGDRRLEAKDGCMAVRFGKRGVSARCVQAEKLTADR